MVIITANSSLGSSTANSSLGSSGIGSSHATVNTRERSQSIHDKQHTPLTANTAKRLFDVSVDDEAHETTSKPSVKQVIATTKKLRRYGEMFDDGFDEKGIVSSKVRFAKKILEVKNRQLVLDRRLKKLDEVKKIEEVKQAKEENRRAQMRWWREATDLGIYKSIEEAKEAEPLDPQ